MNIEQFIPIILATIDYNLTNFTADGLLRTAFLPYVAIFGQMTFGIILGAIGVGLYVNERSVSHVLFYLISIGTFFSFIMPAPIVLFLCIILGFCIAYVLYFTFIEKRSGY